MRYLLIGNGPAALSKEVGEKIDTFKGDVLRFNNYTTKGFEKFVGSRTDIWVTNADYYSLSREEHKSRFLLSARDDDKTNDLAERLRASRISPDYYTKAAYAMRFHHPSSGACVIEWLLDNNHDVWVWGFDYLCNRRDHHYNKDKVVRGDWHNENAEWMYFQRMIDQRKIKLFEFDPAKESFPAIRKPVPCGQDENISWYREAAHNEWYRWFGEMLCKGKTVLDIGAGMCEGIKVLSKYASKVDGTDVDPRLKEVNKDIIITDDLSSFETNSYDVVTCIDVIEHVVDDMVLFNHMKRIARNSIAVTTPNFTRSKAGNIAHCREFTIAQFMNIFKPDKLWSASPDGTVHKTILLEKHKDWIINRSIEGPDNANKSIADIMSYVAYKNNVPLSTRFNNTVDGEEWPHIAAYWHK